MIIGAYRGDLGYDILLFVHILLVVIGAGAAFTLALVGARTSKASGEARSFGLELSDAVDRMLINPTLIVTGFFGIALVTVAPDGAVKMSDAWISIAFMLWIAGVAIGLLVLRKANTELIAAAAAGDEGKVAALEKKLAMFGGINHLILVLLLLDMVIKPFSEGSAI